MAVRFITPRKCRPSARYLRGNIGKVDNRPLKTVCETSAEKLIGSKRLSARRAEGTKAPDASYASKQVSCGSTNDPGATFFHCTIKDHMDEGFAGLITYS